MYHIPRGDCKHDLIYKTWLNSIKSTTSVQSDGRAYTFALWLMDNDIDPVFKTGEYMGCSFENEKEFLGWILKNT